PACAPFTRSTRTPPPATTGRCPRAWSRRCTRTVGCAVPTEVDVQITPASAAERDALTALVQLYAYDLSDLFSADVGDDGRYKTPPLDPYWSGDPRRHPFLIRVDGKLAGFALVHQQSRLTGDESVTDMAEFFVLRRFRR